MPQEYFQKLRGLLSSPHQNYFSLLRKSLSNEVVPPVQTTTEAIPSEATKKLESITPIGLMSQARESSKQAEQKLEDMQRGIVARLLGITDPEKIAKIPIAMPIIIGDLEGITKTATTHLPEESIHKLIEFYLGKENVKKAQEIVNDISFNDTLKKSMQAIIDKVKK